MHWNPREWILAGVLLTAFSAATVGQVPTTQVTDTIYQADGTPATGTVLISWPAFTISSGEAIPSGSISVIIAVGGAFSVQLTPNAGSTPMGSYYTVLYHLNDGTISREYWVVPVSSFPVKIAAIRSTVMPTSVAMQTVSKSYVDTAIAAAITGHPLDSTPYLLTSGDAMTGALVLPGDPVSANQAADKNYVDEAVASVSGGLGGFVSTAPPASQIVTQPSGTQLDINLLSGAVYADQYVTGRGSNGIANASATADCASGCEIIAPQGYTGEVYFTSKLNSQTHIKDLRGGRQFDSFLNPLDVVTHGVSVAQGIDDVSTQSTTSIVQQTGNTIPGSTALAITQEGLAGGSNLFPEQIDFPAPPYFKMGYSALTLNGSYNTQGQHVLAPTEIDCFGVGDCLSGSHFIYASGGFRDSADEGAHPFDLQTHEDTHVFEGTCTSGCTTGSNALSLVQNSGGGTQGDGRFVINVNPAKVITSGAIISGTPGGIHATAQFFGTNFPVSVFLSTGQVIPSQASNQAPGTVTFVIGTSGVPSGFFSNTAALGSSSGLACVVDENAGYAPHNYEMAPYTVIDGTHLQMTFNKPHQTSATLAFGGLCGYGLEQTIDTAGGIRQVFPVVGSFSATALYYAAGATAVVGQMNQTSAFLNLSNYIVSLVRSGNVVTVTTSGNLSADVNGLNVTIAGVLDSSYNGNFVATTIAGNTFTYSQSGANSSSLGGTVAVLTGGFALFQMAEVLSVFDPATKSVDGQMTLAPNNVAWAPNDPVEEPHYYQELISADTQFLGQSVPRPTTTQRAGLNYQQNNGPGLVGWSINNSAPISNYLGYGGTHGVPDYAYESLGPWRRTMSLTAGEQALFTVHCNLHGCANWNSSYNLFELDSSAGADVLTYSPATSNLVVGLRGSVYTISPQAFTAPTINVGVLNASTINGTLSSASITSGSIDGTVIGGSNPAAISATQLNGLPVSEYMNAAKAWDATFLQALYSANTKVVDIKVFGDSFSRCWQTQCGVGPASAADRWPDQLALKLQSQFGSHGTGIVPLLANGASTLDTAWSISGTHTNDNTALGPVESDNGTVGLVHLANGAVATFSSTAQWDTAHVFYATSSSTGNLALNVDGGSVGTANASTATISGVSNSGYTAREFNASAVTFGTHTFTATCSGSGDCFLYAGKFSAGTSGVEVSNLAVGGSNSSFFATNVTTQEAFTDIDPDGTQLAISQIEINDANAGTATATYTTRLTSLIAHEQALSTALPTSFLMTVPGVPVSPTSAVLAPYTATQIALARALNVGFSNVQDRIGSSFVASSGYWDATGTAYPGGFQYTHPSSVLTRDEAALFYDTVVGPAGSGVASSGGCASNCTFTGTTNTSTLNSSILNITAPTNGVSLFSPSITSYANFAMFDSTSAEAGAIGYANPSAGGILQGTMFVYAANHGICLMSVYSPTACGLSMSGVDSSTTLSAPLTAPLYKGPAIAPSGACSAQGWAFSQDGHATFCNGAAWVSKL